MSNTIKIFSILFISIIVLSGCASTKPTQEKSKEDTISVSQNIPRKTYTSQTLGFSIDVPENVLRDSADRTSLAKLDIFEDQGNVYFTTKPLDETMQNSSWDLKISGKTVRNRDEIKSFIQSQYGYSDMTDCELEFNQNQSKAGLFQISIYHKNKDLLLDENPCFISGKTSILYDETSGKIITYNITEPFFFISDEYSDDSEKSLLSLKFPL